MYNEVQKYTSGFNFYLAVFIFFPITNYITSEIILLELICFVCVSGNVIMFVTFCNHFEC